MEDRAVVNALIEQVKVNVVAYIETNAGRLTRYSRLVLRFSEACAAWTEARANNARQITETVNELVIAKYFLQDALCQRLEYETPLEGTGKTIDFLFRTIEGNRIFYDVKTILPEDRDAAQRYEKAKRKGWFSRGTNLTLEGELHGELAHHQLACREKFLAWSLELEGKIRCVPERKDGSTYFRMVFCSDGFRWHRDQLEDFAETYLTQCNSWDHFARMEAHYLKKKGQKLERTIDGFCYFERGPRIAEPVVFQCDVRVPPAALS